MCFNRKVLIGLAAVAGGVLLLAPQAFGAALPLLVVLACPLSMVFMMRGMAGGQSCSTDKSEEISTAAGAGATTPARETPEELIRLRAEVDQLQAELRGRQSPELARESDKRP
ncbi:MAG: DUF2933 domain-containing protein [Acidimicrobiales bacterium]